MGIIAPKDAERQRPFFYIMYDKQISAAPLPDGRGMCPLYQDDGRMVNSAAIVSGVTDENIKELMQSADGFKKLVWSIGVSMQCDSCESADFVFQMYARHDKYGGGTVMRCSVPADGSEQVIRLADVEWNSDDYGPGQIRFEFPSSGFLAHVYVRFYLNDGFTVPVFEAPDKVDTDSEAYRSMIARSLISCGSAVRLKRVIEKARRKEKLTLAFIGGSITQGAGASPINSECYARKIFEGFTKRFDCDAQTTYIKAGVGGTPSELGMIRYGKDVLGDGQFEPDLVVIEFAVNDEGDETGGECFESLAAKILEAPNRPAVILLFSVFANDDNLERRLVPIGEQYRLPMVSVKAAVTEQFYLTAATGRVLPKSQYFYDIYHPTNLGHTIMSDCVLHLIDTVDADQNEPEAEPDYGTLAPVYGRGFEKVELLDREHVIAGAVFSEGSFDARDTQIQCVERNMDLTCTPQFPDNWMHVSGTESFRMKLNCRSLLIVTKDSAEVSAGRAEVLVDGRSVKTVDPHAIGWIHCNAQIILRSDVTAEHEIEVRPLDEDKCFTILGFGVVE